MFRIKICGITRVVDARLVALAGADAIGLNFFHGSPRCVDLATADRIVAEFPADRAKVGIFVNAPADEIVRISERLSLDWVQLHGDEPPQLLAELRSQRVVKAFRFGERGMEQVAAFLASCRSLGKSPDAILIDACQPGEYGGTGKAVDWEAVRRGRAMLEQPPPLVLAGGLTPFNVSDAILAVGPAAVDTATGVESKPGAKDPLLVRAFVSAARKTFAQIEAAN